MVNQDEFQGNEAMLSKHFRCRTQRRNFILFFLVLLMTASILTACNLPLEWMPNWMYRSRVLGEKLNEIQGREYKEKPENFISKLLELFSIKPQNEENGLGLTDDESLPDAAVDPILPDPGEPGSNLNLPLKPVGFTNYGSINATVLPWTYVPLGGSQPQAPLDASTVSTARGGGGDWPNSSRYLSLPLGTYTWCVEWAEDDQDGDGYFDDYHYFVDEPTLLDESASDEIAFAVEVAINAPPDNVPIYVGKCGDTSSNASESTYMGYSENVEFIMRIDFDSGRVSGTIHFDDAEVYGAEGWYWGDAIINGNIDLASYAVNANWTGECGSHYHEITLPWSGSIEGYLSGDLESFSGLYIDDDGTTQNIEAARE